MASKTDNATDSLLHAGRGSPRSYGVNPDSIEEEEEEMVQTSQTRRIFSLKERVGRFFSMKERVWTVAVFSLTACIGSLLVGMFLGFSTNTLSELNSYWNNDERTYGLASNGTYASLFGVRDF